MNVCILRVHFGGILVVGGGGGGEESCACADSVTLFATSPETRLHKVAQVATGHVSICHPYKQ